MSIRTKPNEPKTRIGDEADGYNVTRQVLRRGHNSPAKLDGCERAIEMLSRAIESDSKHSDFFSGIKDAYAEHLARFRTPPEEPEELEFSFS